MKLLPLTIGCDPEGFIANKRGSLVPAEGIIPGTKEKPHPVKCGAVQVDGMAAEFNITPANDSTTFVNNILTVIRELQTFLPEGYGVLFKPVGNFSNKVWDSVSEKSKELGCDPDYNAYTGDVNPRPDGERKYRTAAGHVHVGWTEGMSLTDAGHVTACRMLARQLDFFLGMPLLLVDEDHKRRSMYGKAGAFRVKPYGVEYRTPSNAWLKDPELMAFVFSNTKLAFEQLMAGEDYHRKYPEFAQLMIDEAHKGRKVNEKSAEHIEVFSKAMGIPLPPKKFWVV